MFAAIEKTSKEERLALATNGFLHVTGLVEEHPLHQTGDRYIGENLPARFLGHWDQNNGKIVLVTLGGEVWLRSCGGEPVDASFLRTLAPNGRGGVYVPCSNGESLEFNVILHRLADPDWNPNSRS